MLDAKSLRCAHRYVVTLHEDRFVREVNESRSGHRSWTAPRYDSRLTRGHPFVMIEVTKNCPHFVVGEGGPVRLDERPAHPVHESSG
jgi:hypothetical protein